MLAATLLIGANLSIAMPDVMIDASVAERARPPAPHRGHAVALLGLAYFFSLFSYIAVGHGLRPRRLGGPLRALRAHLARDARPRGRGVDRGRSPPPGPRRRAAASRRRRASETPADLPVGDRVVAATSTLVGNLQAFYLEDDADAVVGGVTVATGAALAGLLYVLLRASRPELAGGDVHLPQRHLAAVHERHVLLVPRRRRGARRCAAPVAIVAARARPTRRGYARAEGYAVPLRRLLRPYMKAPSRAFAGLLGVFAYNRYLSRLPYRKVFSQYQVVYVFANLLDFVWVSRVNA